MKKRLLAICLVICMILGMLPMTAFAEGEGSYVKTDLSQISSDAQVVITMSKGDTVWALTSANGSSKAPTAVEITVEGNKIASDIADALVWNISRDGSNLTIYPNGTTAKWLYCTSTNNGVRVGTNANKVFTIDSSSGYLKHTATSRYLGVYNSQDWRCYTNTTGNTAGQTLAFYVFQENSSEPDCTHTDTTSTTTPATCTAAGSTTVTCDDCGKTISTEVIPATGHNYVNGVCSMCKQSVTFEFGANGAATHYDGKEVSAGQKYTESDYTLTLTSATKVYGEARDAQGNSCLKLGASGAVGSLSFTVPENVKAVIIRVAQYKAKTTKINVNGTAYTIAGSSDNGAYDEITVDTSSTKTVTLKTVSGGERAMVNSISYVFACTHESATETIVKATCTTDGSKTVTCDDCDEVISTEVTPATGHQNTTEEKVDATCTTDGSKTVTCDDCGEVLDTEVIPAGHSYKAEVTAPDCENGGYTTYTCTVCGDNYTADETEATGHSYKAEVTAPNCENGGYTTYTCANCGDSYTSDETSATGHSWNDGEQTTDPGCESEGEKTFTCGTCGATKTGSIPATGHSYEAVVTDPTCTEKGFTTHTCSACGDSYVDSYVDATGHSWNDGEQTTDPGCESEGEKTFTCGTCGATKTEPVSATGHSYKAEVTAPDCENGGFTTYTCTVCGNNYTADETEATGHSYESVVTAPNCENGGYTTYTCTVCGDSYTADETEATGHNNVTTTTVDATCTDDGSVTVTCDDCDEVLDTEVIPATGHSYEAVVTPPTLDAGGYTTYTCTGCDDSYIADETPALGVAQIGETKYASLQAALDAAKDNDVVRLLRDVQVSNYLDIYTPNDGETPREFTLDLNGYTISKADDYKYEYYPLLFVGINQTVTLTGGTITSGEYVTVGVYGVLKLEDAIIECTGDDPDDDAALCIWHWDHNDPGYEGVATGAAEISGGKIVGGLFIEGDTAISGGDIDRVTVERGQTTITGGTFGHDVKAYCAAGYTTVEVDGRYTVEPCIHADCTCTDNGDGTHTFTCTRCGEETITEDHSMKPETGNCSCGLDMAVASTTVGGTTTYYATLKDAIAAAAVGTEDAPITVEVLKDIDMTETIYVFSGVFTLNLNGMTLRDYESDGLFYGLFQLSAASTAHMTIADTEGGKLLADWGVVTVDGGTVTITGGAFDCEGTGLGASVTVYGGTVNISGGTIHSIDADYGTVNISGGSIESSHLDMHTTCNISGGTIGRLAVYSTESNVKLSGGAFEEIRCENAVSRLLANGYSYWTPDGTTMLNPAEDTEIFEVIVKATCNHPAEKLTYKTCDSSTHTWHCSDCNNDITEAHTASATYALTADGTQHIATYGCCNGTVTEAHTFGDVDTCACGAKAKAKNKNTGIYYATLAEALEQAKMLNAIYALADFDGAFTIPQFVHFYGEEFTFSGEVTNEGAIQSGTFTAEVINNCDIYNGTFQGKVTTNRDSSIRNGTFNGEVFVEGSIRGGTFNNVVNNHGAITGGTFNNTVINTTGINNGIFQGEVINNAKILGGTFNGTLTNNEDGQIWNHCTAITIGEDFKYVNAGGTVTGDHNNTSEANCLNKAVCSFCGEYGDVDLTKHNYEAVVTEPDCENGGYTTYTCADCGDSYVGDETSALGHKYEAVVTEPDCENGGYTTYTCANCGDSYVADETPATGHSYEAVVTAPTCTEKGYTTHTCANCGDSYTDSEVAELGHNYSDVVIAPTCDMKGYTIHVCTRCDYSLADSYVDELGHSYEGVVTAPDCENGGYTTYTCTACGDSYVADETPALGHDLSDCYCDNCGEYIHDLDENCFCAQCEEYWHTPTSGDDCTCLICGAPHAFIVDNYCRCDNCHEYIHDLDENCTCTRCGEAFHSGVDSATGNCVDCGQFVAAVSVTADGAKTYYYTFQEGLAVAQQNENCTLRFENDFLTTDLVYASGTFTIDLNGKRGFNPALYMEAGYVTLCDSVGGGDYSGAIVAEGGTLRIESGYYSTYINCKPEGNVIITGGEIERVSFFRTGGSITIYGGSFDWVWGDTDHPLDSMLADGHCYYDADNKKVDTASIEMINGKYILEYVTVSCDHMGNTQNCLGYLCERCGEYFGEGDPNGHEYEAVVTNPDCVNDGYTTYTCTVCGDSYVADEVDALGHEYEAVVTEPDCENGGYTTYTCTVCGDSYVADEVPALGHKYEAVVTDPDCENGGCTTHTCANCGDSYVTDEIPALGHKYEAVVTDPDCENGGCTTHTCANCGDSYVTDEIPALGHEYEAVVTDPDCENGGCTTHTCANCGDSYVTDEIPALGHKYEAVVTDPDCVNDGYTTYTCTVCGDSYVADEVSALGHEYEAVVTDPDCENGGYTTYTCTVCGDSYVADEVPALGHKYEAVVTEPDCTEYGYTTYTCANCGDSYMDDITDPLGHKHEVTEVVAPDCENEGYTVYTCSACGHSYIADYTQPLDHKNVPVYTAPDCENSGYTTYTCANCGDSYVTNEIPALGHDYQYGACDRCGAEDPEYVAPEYVQGMTMTLGNSLAVNFVVDEEPFADGGYYAVITKQYADGTAPITVTVPQSDWEVYDEGRCYFTFFGVKAKEMTDTIEVLIYNADGKLVCAPYERTVADYCLDMVERYEQPGIFDAERLALYVDILNYGAAAQDFFGYNTEDLANAGLTDAQRAYASKRPSATDIRVKGAGYAGSTLSLLNEIQLNFVYNNNVIDKAAYAVVSYTHHCGAVEEYTVEAADFQAYGTMRKYVEVNNLKIADGGQVVTVTLYDASGNVLSVSQDSMNAYAVRKGDEHPVYDAVLKLTESAYNYFH